MIETLENGAQLAAVTACFVLALRRRARDRAYEALALFYSAYLLGVAVPLLPAAPRLDGGGAALTLQPRDRRAGQGGRRAI